MSLYLGPLGGLVQIHPLTEVEVSPERFGGVHTSITGRRTVDYFGSAEEYGLRWRHQSPAQLGFLRALAARHVPGPLRFVLGDLRPNRLSQSAAAFGYGGRDLRGVSLLNGTGTPSSLHPAEAGIPGAPSMLWSGWTGQSAVRLDLDTPVPVVPGETLTISAWVYSPAGDDVMIGAYHFGATGTLASTTASALVTLAPNTWTRLTRTITPTPDIWAIAPTVQVMTNRGATELILANAQVEVGASAGDWFFGGGAPVVVVDSVDFPSPYGHFTDPELTLLEV